MYARNLFKHMFPIFLEAIESEIDIIVLNTMLASFVKCLDVVAAPVFDQAELEKCVACLKGTCNDYKEHMETFNEQKEDGDLDEEEEERINDDISSCEDSIGSVADMAGRLVKYHGSAFLAVFTPLVENVFEFIKPKARVAERHVALCIVDDIVQYGGKDAISIIPQVINLYFAYLKDSDPALRQAAAFGLGIFAQMGQDIFAQYVPEALLRLGEVCAAPGAREEENLTATENAISSVGRICITFPHLANLDQILPGWLHQLPITEDEEEAVVVLKNLCSFIEQATTKILGPNYEHLPKALYVLAEAFGKEYVGEDVKKRVVGIIKGLQRLPQDVLQKTWAAISPELQSTLQQALATPS